jgi:DNA-binding LytR/AlgR family response regulator
LVTSDRNFAIEAFEYECIVDYLVKPINADRFLIQKSELFEKTILKEFKPKGRTMQMNFINIDRRLVKIEMASVNIVQAKGDYIHIKTKIEIILNTEKNRG